MCGGPEEPSDTSSYAEVNGSIVNEVEGCDLENGDSISHLLELAASNDLEGFQKTVKELSAEVNGVGSWYGRRNGTNMMMREHRTPAMIASLFGSVEVLKYILSNFDFQEVTNKKCGSDCSSALHCAAAGGSTRAIETVILLLDFGADLNFTDAHGKKPVDVIAPFPKRHHVKEALKDLLEAKGSLQDKSREFLVQHGVPLCLEDEKSAFMVDNGKVDTISGVSVPISLFTSSDGSPFSSPSPSSSPTLLDMVSRQEGNLDREKAREYFVDPSIPDIKYSLYMTDEFRMFSFKVRPCSRAYSHDWTECPFVHPGENARRRDPRRYHYSCVPCPDFRKGACRRGDACEYAHGVFESWLHPAQYRTRLCKDGIDCTRRVCFFAHTNDELRPLYVSSGSAMPCPRTTSPMDMLNVSPPLRPGSPLSPFMLNAFSSSSAQGNHTTPPMSPSSSPANSLVGAVWSPSNVPLLHLPGANSQASRLRSALNARDISLEDYGWALELDGPNEMTPLSSHFLSTQARLNAAVAATSSSRYRNLGLTISPTGLEELSPSDFLSSPRSLTQGNSLISPLEGQMQSHKLSPLSAHMQGKLGSPSFSSLPDQYLQLQQAVALDPQMLGSPRRQSGKKIPAYSLGSLGHMQTPGGLAVDMQTGPFGQVTPSGLDIDVQTCNGTSLPPSVVATRAAFAQGDKRSLSSREMATGCWASDWGSLTGKTGWGSPTGKPEWGVPGEGLSKCQKSASFVSRGIDKPDVLVPAVIKEKPAIDCDNGVGRISTDESISYSSKPVDHLTLGSWMENIQLDEIIA